MVTLRSVQLVKVDVRRQRVVRVEELRVTSVRVSIADDGLTMELN